MQKYIERMIVERDDLKGKISKAKKAIDNPPYGSDAEGLKLLSEQVTHMKDYLAVLEKRILNEKSK